MSAQKSPKKVKIDSKKNKARLNPKTADKKKKKRIKKSRFLIFCLKIALLLGVILLCVGIYFYQVIKERVENQVWHLPATIYGRIFEFDPKQSTSLESVTERLKSSGYRQVMMATRPGEFVVGYDQIDVYRRSFFFPNGEEPALNLRFSFKNQQLNSIVDIEKRTILKSVQLDPKLITMIYSPNNEQRLFVNLNQFPGSLVNVLLATEDRYFFDHSGVNYMAIARALLVNMGSSGRTEGGSTLTQQLIKNLFLTNQRSYWRKLKEFYMAQIMDATYSKGRILELYLNEVYLGQNGNDAIHGFPFASQYYFGRPVNELTLDQQALLVGMLKGPALYNPRLHPEQALARRNLVLQIIYEQGIIDETLLVELQKRPLGVLPKGTVILPQPNFIQGMNQALKKELGASYIQLAGAKIFTTFDPLTSQFAEQAISVQFPELIQKSQKPELQMAMVIMDKETGEIRSLIGSREPFYAGFNRALTMQRSVGSLIKPAVYLTALSEPNRYRLNTLISDSPISVKLDRKKTWEPKNFDHRYRGNVELMTALAQSLNVPTVRLGMDLGLSKVNTTIKKLGIPDSAIKKMPSILLGTMDLSPIEMAQFYQTIAHYGFLSKVKFVRSVLNENNQLIYQSNPRSKQAVAPQAAYLTLYALQDVVKNGTAKQLNASFSHLNLAGKTGTTNDNKDSWYAGIDGENVVIIWVGMDNHSSMNLTGSSGALSLYRTYLTQSLETISDQIKPLQLPRLKNIDFIGINSENQLICNPPFKQILPFWQTTSTPNCL